MEEKIIKSINSNKIKLLGEGYISRSYKIEINSKKYVLLQGQIKDSYSCYSKAFKNLTFIFNNGDPFIKSIKVPFNEIYLIKPNLNFDFFKYGALIYKEIEGVIFLEKYIDKINKENITDSISQFIKELYAIPINRINISEIRNKKLKEFTNDMFIIKNYFKGKNLDKINKFEKEYLDYIDNFKDYHYIHGDLWEENMIISDNYQDLVGVVDFDNFGINDIAKDYASLLDFGFEFIDILLDKTKEIIKDKDIFIERIKIYQKIIELEDTVYILRDINLRHRLNKKIELLKTLDLLE